MAERANTYAEAVRYLARRPLTVLELQDRLRQDGHAAGAVEAVLERLLAEGSLDDRALASHYMSTRMTRLGHGPERLVRDLVGRGVDAAVAGEALATGLRQGDLDPEGILRREIDRRLPGDTITPREHRRVYNAMLRAGFEPLSIRRAMERYRRDPDSSEPETMQE